MDNAVILVGELLDDFRFKFTSRCVDYYESRIRIMRTSGVYDVLPVLVSEMCFFPSAGEMVKINGAIRSYNICRKSLCVYVKADSISITDEDFQNRIVVQGNICKKGKHRRTPLGRFITDFILAVNNMDTSFYIPCIAWSLNSMEIDQLPIGSEISLSGRIQSREYIKENTVRNTIEVSVNTFLSV